MKKLRFFFVMLASFKLFAGTVSEISLYIHPETNKQVVFFGALHIEEETVVNEQLSKFKEIMELVSRGKHEGNTRIITEGTDSENMFSKLDKELTTRNFIHPHLDVRSIFSDTLSKLDGAPSQVNLSISDIVDHLAYPLKKISEHKIFPLINYDSVQKCREMIAEMEKEFDDMLAENLKNSRIELSDAKKMPLNQLVNKVDVYEAIQALAQIHAAKSAQEDALKIPDSFDVNSILDIVDATETVIFHISGVNHKVNIEAILLLLGFKQTASFNNQDAEQHLGEMNKKLEDAIKQKFGEDIPEESLPEVAEFIIDNQKAVTSIYAPLIKIPPQYFDEAISLLNF